MLANLNFSSLSLFSLVFWAAASILAFALLAPASAFSLDFYILAIAAFWAAIAFYSFSLAICSLSSLAAFLYSNSLFYSAIYCLYNSACLTFS
jgi:hypothetical protein